MAIRKKSSGVNWLKMGFIILLFGVLLYAVLQKTTFLGFAQRSQSDQYQRAMQLCQSQGGSVSACKNFVARRFPNMVPSTGGAQGNCPSDGYRPDGTYCGGPTGASGATTTDSDLGRGGGSSGAVGDARLNCGTRCAGLPTAFSINCVSVCNRINSGESCSSACNSVPSQYRSMCTSTLCN